MPAYSYLVADNFLPQVRRVAMIPTQAKAFQDEDILALANHEIQSYVVPLLLKAREEYLVANKTQSVGTSTSFDVPMDAIGRKLRDVLWSQTAALTDTDEQFMSLSRLNPDEIPQSNSIGFTLQAGSVVLHGISGGTLRLKYFRRPGKLTAAVDTLGAAVDYGSVMTGISLGNAVVNTTNGFSVGDKVDVISGPTTGTTIPTFETTLSGTRISNISSGVITLAGVTSISDYAAIGYYIMQMGMSPFIQLPEEVHPLVVQRTAVKYLEAIGDPKVNVAKALADEMEKNMFPMVSPRVEGASRVIVNRRGPGMLGRYGGGQ